MVVVVGVIMIGSLTAPLIFDMQKNAGDKVTYTNTALNSYRLAENSEDVTISLEYDSDASLWDVTIGTVEFTTASDGANANICYSDAVTVTKSADGSMITVYYNGLELSSTANKTVVFSDGTVTVTNTTASTEVYSADYTWLYVYDADGEYVNISGSAAIYVNTIEDIVMSGSYVSGENDTYYDYKDGVLTLSADYTSGLSYDIDLVDGTTDVYKVSNIVLTVGDETFTPYRVLVAAEITGHESSGAEYSLLGAIPIAMILGLIMLMVGFIQARKEE